MMMVAVPQQLETEQPKKGEALFSSKATRPLVEHRGILAGEAPVDLAPLAKAQLSGAFSFMCTLQMDRPEVWARVFDFSMNPDEDSITAGTIEGTCDFHFTVFQGYTPVGVRVDDFFELGKEATVLFTVSSDGHMKVFKDGALVGENAQGVAPAPVERPHMVVGGHFHFTNQAFCGSLSNVKVWDQEVSWTAAMEAPRAAVPCAAAVPYATKAPPVPVPCADVSTAGGSGSETASQGADSDSEPEAEAHSTVKEPKQGAGFVMLPDED